MNGGRRHDDLPIGEAIDGFAWLEEVISESIISEQAERRATAFAALTIWRVLATGKETCGDREQLALRLKDLLASL